MSPRCVSPHGKLTKALRKNFDKAIGLEEKPKPVGFFRCSDTGKCGRKSAYFRIGQQVSNPHPADAREKMDKGHLFHDHIRYLITELTPYRIKYEEVPLEDSFEVNGTTVRLKGHCDGVLYDKKDNPQALLEVKSTSEWGYKSTVKAAFTEPQHYSSGYLLQANRYAHLWNLMCSPLVLKQVCILVYNVNGTADPDTGFPMKDWWFAIDKKLFQEDLTRLAAIQKVVEDGQVPERYFKQIDWECSSCVYFDDCWPDNERVFANARIAKKVQDAAKARKRTRR